jgi:PIN domain nuclease of toxin-antitoxin system
VRLLLDTHLLIWLASEPEKLSREARAIIADSANVLLFSAISMWEIAIKRALGRPDFAVDPHPLRDGLIARGYAEIAMTSEHGLVAGALPLLHRDPFDRAMIGQAMVERVLFLTADVELAGYGAAVRVA